MAMATVVASRTYLSLPPHLSRHNAPVTCTSACIGYCYRTIPWSRRRTREIQLCSLEAATKSFRSASIEGHLLQLLVRQRRRKRWGTRANGEIMEGDVVEYPLPEKVKQGGLYGDSSYGVGAVHELVSDDSSSSLVCHIEPLVMNDPPRATWVVDERQDIVVASLSEVRLVAAWLSMRMVDDRISNPHGEHAEHLWLVEEPLSASAGSPMYDEAPSNQD